MFKLSQQFILILSLNIAFCLISSFSLLAQAEVKDLNSACRLPFEYAMNTQNGRAFDIDDAVNHDSTLSQNLRQRYIVADYNTKTDDHQCKGVQEYFAPINQLSDFDQLNVIADIMNRSLESFGSLSFAQLQNEISLRPDSEQKSQLLAILSQDPSAIFVELTDLHNLMAMNAKFATAPIVKPPHYRGYCIGQTLNYCEIKNSVPTLMFRFVTSARKYAGGIREYYAPINYISTRHWSSDRRYTADDIARDIRLGGGDDQAHLFANNGRPIEMPNFMNFRPLPGYTGSTQNGIHEIAGGTDSGGTFGAPVSLGCSRLNDYQSKLSRWWTPRQAHMFIFVNEEKYVKFAH